MNPTLPVRIRLFGTPSLERADRSAVTGRPAQRHRIALLALLSLAPSRRMSRDKAMAWLWPEADAERARNLLNVSVYVLRSALGEGIVVSAGEDIRLGDDVSVDVAEFESAVAPGDHERVVALYAGPFLDGFFLAEAEEFEAWTERQRQRLADLYGKSLAALAEAAEAAGDHGAAVDRWRARAALDPYDSRIALRLMRALEASGNRAGAIQYAAEHARLLREEVGVEAGEVVRAAEEMRGGRGDKVEKADEAEKADKAEGSLIRAGSSPSTDASASSASSAFSTFKLGAPLAVLALALIAWLAWPRGEAPARSIVVLPFANLSPGSEGDYFGNGLTDELITSLATVPGLTVIARTSAMRYATSVASIPEIAGELNVANVLHGSIRHEGDEVRVSAQLVEAEGERVLWARTYDSKVRDMFRVQEAIAREVARELEIELASDSAGTPLRRSTGNLEAYELYRRGRHFWATRSKAGHEQAFEYYRQALALDSTYADAYAGLADAYLTSYHMGVTDLSEEESYSRLKWAAERAIALDARSADAHASLAAALWWQRNWPGAERELRRAIALNPNHAQARNWYGNLLIGQGRTDEALREGRRSVELDPFALLINLTYAWICYAAEENELADAQFRRTLEINPEWVPTLSQFAIQLALQGHHAEALRVAEEVVGEGAYELSQRAAVEALVGRRSAATASLARAKASPYVMIRGFPTFAIARVHAVLGQHDSAFAWLERSDWVWPHRALLADPLLDPLRDDPRFAALSARIEREMGLR